MVDEQTPLGMEPDLCLDVTNAGGMMDWPTTWTRIACQPIGCRPHLAWMGGTPSSAECAVLFNLTGAIQTMEEYYYPLGFFTYGR